ncbi:MAG: hypothetical protein ACUVUG_04805 [Candidatus Aminicenantia bacterium]
MKVFSILFSLLFLFPKPFFIHSEAGDGKRDITVEKDEVYSKNIISFGGEITVRGTAKKSIIVIGGIITIYGNVEEDVIGIGSKVSVLKGAKINGDLLVIGGRLRKDRETCIEGDMFYFKPSRNFPLFLKSVLKDTFTFSLKPYQIFAKLITLLSWFLIVLIITLIFPSNVTRASISMNKKIGKSLLLGVLAILIIVILLVFFGFLSIFLIGIPFLVLVLIGFVLSLFFGRSAIFHWLGSVLLKLFGRDVSSVLPSALLGFLVFFLLSFIPLLSILMKVFVDLAGIGITFITRFGTREG